MKGKQNLFTVHGSQFTVKAVDGSRKTMMNEKLIIIKAFNS